MELVSGYSVLEVSVENPSSLIPWLCRKEISRSFQLPEKNYPDFALVVASAVQSGEVDRGIIICGSGIGATIVANKVNNCDILLPFYFSGNNWVVGVGYGLIL